jgi:hypothetical protein
LVDALLRAARSSHRNLVFDFLDGLSTDELECLAEFHGACLLEAAFNPAFNAYRLMADFFDPAVCQRWQNPGYRAHKTFVVLAWLDKLDSPAPIHLLPSR